VKRYHGERRSDGRCVVIVIDRTRGGVPEIPLRELRPRFDLRNHSPDGFNWGYGGSGPSQLALALLADALDSDKVALELYQQFKWAVVCRLAATWTLTTDEIIAAVDALRQTKEAR